MKAGWMIVAGLLFACMGVFVKLGAEHFSAAELVFYRSAIGLVVIFLIIKFRRLPITTENWKMHCGRGISGFAALMLFFYSISLLPLATAVTLNYTSPMFLAILMTLILKERLNRVMVLVFILGFLGVVLLLQPTFGKDQLLGGIMGLLSGVLAGFAYLNIKRLGAAGEPDWRVVFYFTLISTIGAGLWMAAHDFHRVNLSSLWLLLGLGASATLAQLALTRAYQTGKTLTVGSLAYSTVVFASLLGVILWQEFLSPLSWLGIALIIASGILSMQFGRASDAAKLA